MSWNGLCYLRYVFNKGFIKYLNIYILIILKLTPPISWNMCFIFLKNQRNLGINNAYCSFDIIYRYACSLRKLYVHLHYNYQLERVYNISTKTKCHTQLPKRLWYSQLLLLNQHQHHKFKNWHKISATIWENDNKTEWK